VYVAAALPQTAGRPSGVVADPTRIRKHSQLSAPVVATILSVIALAGCAPDRGRSTSMDYSERDSVMVRPAEASPIAKVSRTVKVSRTANTSTSTKAGLKTLIPLPEQALLTPQPEPDCEFKTQPQQSPLDPDIKYMKLDYERQCYRQAEISVRARLRLLQASVGETIKAAILGPTADPRPAAPSKTEAPQKPQ
jgi:hypothetical protein